MLSSVFYVRPPRREPCLQLVRIHDRAVFLLISDRFLWLPSHWEQGRSWPCTERLCGTCPRCLQSSPRRNYAYAGALHGYLHTEQRDLVILELSEHVAEQILEKKDQAAGESFTEYVRGSAWTVTKPNRYAKAKIERLQPTVPSITVPEESIIRTLCRIYSMPERENFSSMGEWQEAVQRRILDPAYSPGKAN